MGHRLHQWLEIKPRAACIAAALWTCGCAAALAGLSNAVVAGVIAVVVAAAGLSVWAQRTGLAIFFVCALLLGVAYAQWRAVSQTGECDQLFDRWSRFIAVVEECQMGEDSQRCRLWLRLEEREHQPMPTAPSVVAKTSTASLPPDIRNWHQGLPRVRVALQMSIRKGMSAQFPWDFDEARYIQRRGAIGVGLVSKRRPVRVVGNEPLGQADRFAAFVDVIRQRMVRLHRVVLSTESGDLLSSMVIGDKAVRPSQAIQQQFQALGLTHIIAASGFNLTIVTAVAWWSLRLFSRSAIVNTGWCLLSIGFFCVLAGFSASVERAALMCSFLLLASLFRRSAHLPAVIGLALFMTTLLEPNALLDVGLQLSYAATLCIALCATRLTNFLNERARVPRAIAEIVGAVALANASVLPLQMMYFWQVGELSLPANIAVSPFVPPITVLGFISSAFAAFGAALPSLIGVGLDWLVKLPLWAMMRIVESFAANRWAVLSIGPPLPAFVWFYYLSLAALITAVCNVNEEAKRRWFVVATLVLYMTAAATLFVRLPLKFPTIICARDAELLIVPENGAYWFGSGDSVSIQRAVKYLAVNRCTFVPLALDAAGIDSGQKRMETSNQSRVFQLTRQGVRRVQSVEALWWTTSTREPSD